MSSVPRSDPPISPWPTRPRGWPRSPATRGTASAPPRRRSRPGRPGGRAPDRLPFRAGGRLFRLGDGGGPPFRRDAFAQRVHDADDIARGGRRLGFRLRARGALLLFFDDVDETRLDGVADHVEAPGFLALLDQPRHQLEQSGIELGLPFRAEDFVRIAHFVAEPQRPEFDALVAGLEKNGALATVEDEAGDADHAGRAHRVADHAIGLFADRIIRGQVIGRVVPDPVDAVGRREALDIDGAGALELDRRELLVLEHNETLFVALVSPNQVVLVDRASGLGVDISADDAVAGPTIEGMKADLLGFACRRRHRDRAGDQRELEVPFPEGTRRHPMPLRSSLDGLRQSIVRTNSNC